MTTHRSVRLLVLSFIAVLATACTVRAEDLPAVESYGDRIVVKKDTALGSSPANKCARPNRPVAAR